MFRWIVLLFSLLNLVPLQGLEKGSRPNVLLIICDDLNDAVGGLRGHPQTRTPNLDRFREQALSFTNAHSNAPLCNPSRASVWSGLYPHTTGFYGYAQHENKWRENPTLKNTVNLFERFHENGYSVYGTGKIFHGNSGNEFLELHDEAFGINPSFGPNAYNGKETVAHPSLKKPYGSWAMQSFGPLSDIPSIPADPLNNVPGYQGWWDKGQAFRYTNEDDRDLMVNELSAQWTVDLLKKDHEKPFFITVGIMRPHRPMYAPGKYFEDFPLESIQLPVYFETDLDDVPEVLWKDLTRLERRKGFDDFKELMEAYPDKSGWKRWVQAYLACVAFLDAQVGKIVTALEDSSHANNTIVLFTSDHGYHMGEKDYMFKLSVWEEATRIPFFIRVPGATPGSTTSDHPVSLIDLYPTLVDLCELAEPPNRNAKLDGHSLAPFLVDPKRTDWAGPDVALSVVFSEDPLEINAPGDVYKQHFTVRSKRYRYTLCGDGREELYDHLTDPHEWENLAKDSSYTSIKRDLKSQLLRITGRAN